MSDRFTNVVRPFTGAVHKIKYRRGDEIRVQAWYAVGAVAWSADGKIGTCVSVKRCPLEATLDAIRQAQRHMGKHGRIERRMAERKAVTA